MSQFGPGTPIFKKGDYVLTPKRQPGLIVGAYAEQEPQHDWVYWDHDLNCWYTDGDEYLQWVYRIEVTVNGEKQIEPWPEDMLERASILDALTA